MDDTATLLRRRDTALPRGLAQAHPLFAERACNAELWDRDARRYIDFTSGIAVSCVGHAHPAVIAAVEAQLARFHHTCFQVVAFEAYLALVERLAALAPVEGPCKGLLFNSGAEAVENAVKIARAATGRSGVIAFRGGFHGRTLFALGLTGKVEPYKAGFGPFAAEVFHAPYPSMLEGIGVDDALAGLQALFAGSIEPARVAAIIVEPVQGEGGYLPAPPEFLRELRAIADRHAIVLVVDEVQSGIARCGRMFAIEHADVVTDLLCLAKGLGGGLPIAALIGRAGLMDAVAPGGLGSTFGGNPLSCAAAHAVLDLIARENLCERATMLGERMIATLRARLAALPVVAEIRGLGAMVGVALRGPDAADTARAIIADARRRGLLLLSCGRSGDVLRLMPPLTIPVDILDEGLEMLCASILSVSARR